MKLTLFAMIAFLAVTASANAIPGDSDSSVSRLEKRMGDEPYEEADEGAKVYGDFFEYREHMEASYKQMQESEMAHSLEMEEKEVLQEHQDRLKEHNANNPDDPLEVEHGSVYNKIILGEQMDEVCERQSDTFDDMKAANLDMSGALDEMAKKDSDDEDDSILSATSPFIVYLGSMNRYQTFERKCLHIWELYKGL
ncbi:hypothetical protein BASA50_008457 [Batrachochytrium salamandrivorans]|uniref:DUF1771 domain-containing protein n=1 Tax=Batrachochytrium salamandrivorans TaxID=1357716 RepID=A0ABQ8F440_9FUNG|nr:hypothetical protein BASA50_008457 [Batrachochytrium salamandrivorans]